MASHTSSREDRLRIAVVSPVDPRVARTNTVADVRLCAALASHGHEVRWIVPSVGPRRELSASEIWRIHDLSHLFDIQFVRTPRQDGPRDLARIMPLIVSRIRPALFGSRQEISISRDVRLLVPLLASAKSSRAVPWLHEYRDEFWERQAYRRVSRVLATNSAIVKDLHRRIPSVSAFITGNPISEERIAFARETTRDAARRALGIDEGGPLVVYTGKLYPRMAEVEHLLQAATNLPRCRFLLTGGQPAALSVVRDELAQRSIHNVMLTGFLERPESTRLYQQAADILVSYYSVKDHPFACHNLPGKLAEYMSTGNPVVVADFPAVRDIASATTAVLVPPDDPAALTEALRRVLRDPRAAAELGASAQRLVHHRSYEQVAHDLGSFLTATVAGKRDHR